MPAKGVKVLAFAAPLFCMVVAIGAGSLVYFDRGLGESASRPSPSYIFE